MNKIMRGAAHTFLLMAALTLISKFLGFIREMIIANYYGTSYIVDSYVMAIAIPSIIFGGIFGAVGTAFMPTFSSIVEKEGEEEANKFTSQILNLLAIVSVIASIFGIFFAQEIVNIFASGFKGETAKLTVFFLKITFTFVIFTSTANIMDAYLHYKGIFLKPIIVNYFQNIAIIIVIIISAYTTHYIMAFGTLIGVAVRLVIISYITKKEGYKYTPIFKFGKTVKNIMGLAVPVFIGTYIMQINSFVDKTLASGLKEGSVSALNYAIILILLFTGLTVSLMVTMIYPKITKANTNLDLQGFNSTVEKGMNIILILSIPASLGIIAFSDEAVQIVYERGAFDQSATSLTAGAFFFYGIGLTFFALNELLTKIYYSRRNTRAPIVFSAISVIINIILNFALIGTMAHKGLALATSVSAMINTLMLYYWMKHKYPEIAIMKSKRKLAKITISAALAVGIAYFINELLVSNIWMPRMIYLGISMAFATAIYLGSLRAFKIEEINLIKDIFKRK